MADITTFYPGGNPNEAVPHATNAVLSDTVDLLSVTTDDAEATTGTIKFWSGPIEDYNDITTKNSQTLYIITPTP